MNKFMRPQTLRGANAEWLRVVASVGGVSRQGDVDRDGSGPRRSDGAPVREALWTVDLDGQRVRCELRHHGKYGVEYRLFLNNEFYQGRGFQTRERAVQAAASVRRQFEDDGWSSSAFFEMPGLSGSWRVNR